MLKLHTTDTCMKRWGLRASSLSADTKADAGQRTSSNHLNPNVLYMMLGTVLILFFKYFQCLNLLPIKKGGNSCGIKS
jgi:hypothetical protein